MLLMTISISNAFAEWLSIGVHDGGDIYADPKTIVKEGSQVRIWALADYKGPRIFGRLKPLLSMMVQTEFDCVERQSRGLTFLAYSGNMASGEVEDMSGARLAYIDTNPKSWTPIPPNGTGPALFKFACQ